jgi:hypothetical protein
VVDLSLPEVPVETGYRKVELSRNGFYAESKKFSQLRSFLKQLASDFSFGRLLSSWLWDSLMISKNLGGKLIEIWKGCS